MTASGPAGCAKADSGEDPRVGGIGEDAILEAVLPVYAEHRRAVEARLVAAGRRSPMLLGPGDDCTVLDPGPEPMVMTTDTLTENQDFRGVWPNGLRTSGRDLAAKSVAQNLADVAAMGAVPTGVLISLTLPPETRRSWVLDLAEGFVAAVEGLGAHECLVAGGDLGAGAELSLTVTAWGRTNEGVAPVMRSGARPGDVVVLAGTVGRAAGGLEVLQDPAGPLPRRREDRPDRLPHEAEARALGAGTATDWDQPALADAQLRPQPPLAMGPELARLGVTAMIDVSDGLIRDAGRIARASGVGLDLRTEGLEPLVSALRPVARERRRDPLHWVLAGGEDHGLLACLPPGTPLPPGVLEIGSCVNQSSRPDAVTVDGNAPSEPGWDHFAAEDRI